MQKWLRFIFTRKFHSIYMTTILGMNPKRTFLTVSMSVVINPEWATSEIHGKHSIRDRNENPLNSNQTQKRRNVMPSSGVVCVHMQNQCDSIQIYSFRHCILMQWIFSRVLAMWNGQCLIPKSICSHNTAAYMILNYRNCVTWNFLIRDIQTNNWRTEKKKKQDIVIRSDLLLLPMFGKAHSVK